MNRRDLPELIAVTTRLLQRNVALDCDQAPEIGRLLAPVEVEALLGLVEVAAYGLSESTQRAGGMKEARHDHK